MQTQQSESAENRLGEERPVLQYNSIAPQAIEGLRMGRASFWILLIGFAFGTVVWILVIPAVATALVLSLVAVIWSKRRSVVGLITLSLCTLMLGLVFFALVAGR
jgi:hypothetical protein